MPRLKAGMRIHLVGVAGAGLSAIARILLERGCIVSGSDLNSSRETEALATDGARIYHGHDPNYVEGADLVLATSAASDDHVELQAAQRLGIPAYRRREFMPLLLTGYDTIAVAGTHGKTTTTSMIIHILQRAGHDPSYIVGGTMGNTGRNAGVGSGADFVIEADEYGNMFHGLSAQLAVITTVEHDHPDYFGTPAAMTAAFEKFLDSRQPNGLIVACADDAGALALADASKRQGAAVVTYGIANVEADLRATDLDFGGEVTTFDVSLNGLLQGTVRLGLPGTHNVLNALAALAVAHLRAVPFETTALALADFKATERRFQIRGERDGVIVVDDYAHHPTEVKVSIQAARLRYPGRQVWAIWQPHTYSRVQLFWNEFIAAFHGADRVLVTPIYAAREAPIDGVSSQALVEQMNEQLAASYTPSYDHAVALLRRSIVAPAVLLIFSAGDANVIADLYLGDEALTT